MLQSITADKGFQNRQLVSNWLLDFRISLVVFIGNLLLWRWDVYAPGENNLTIRHCSKKILERSIIIALLLLLFHSWICAGIDWSYYGYLDSLCFSILHVLTCCYREDAFKACSKGRFLAFVSCRLAGDYIQRVKDNWVF